MGVVANFIRIPPSRLKTLLSESEAADDFFHHDQHQELGADAQIDIDKSWHIIHYLLTGTIGEAKEPFGDAVLGGKPFSSLNVGYGPPRYLTPEEVAAVSDALSKISEEELWARTAGDMRQYLRLYPEWMPNQDEKEYVLYYFEALKSFYAKAAKAHEAVILFAN